MSIERMIDALIGREGGYSNHPSDTGGKTRWGITEAVARKYGYRGDMRSLPREEAARIYRFQYYLSPGFDKIGRLSADIAEELFDTGVNMGQKRAIVFLQRALNVLNRRQRDYKDISLDGVIGGQTVGALAAYIKKRGHYGILQLTKALECLQGATYVELCERREANEDFLFGWLAHRVGSLHDL